MATGNFPNPFHLCYYYYYILLCNGRVGFCIHPTRTVRAPSATMRSTRHDDLFKHFKLLIGVGQAKPTTMTTTTAAVATTTAAVAVCTRRANWWFACRPRIKDEISWSDIFLFFFYPSVLFIFRPCMRCPRRVWPSGQNTSYTKHDILITRLVNYRHAHSHLRCPLTHNIHYWLPKCIRWKPSTHVYVCECGRGGFTPEG